MHTCLVQGGGEEEPGQWKEEAQSSRAGGGRRWLRSVREQGERKPGSQEHRTWAWTREAGAGELVNLSVILKGV